MPFQIRSFNTGLAVISRTSSLSPWILSFVIAWQSLLCYLQFNHHTIVIHTTQHHYQSLTTPNDVTLLFATKCSIIIPFNCHTLDHFFFTPVALSAFSTPYDFTGYGQAFPGRILLQCQPTFVYARDIPIRRMRKKSGCTTWKASYIHSHVYGIFIICNFFFLFLNQWTTLYLIAQHFSVTYIISCSILFLFSSNIPLPLGLFFFHFCSVVYSLNRYPGLQKFAIFWTQISNTSKFFN